jgi:hypothetical protein
MSDNQNYKDENNPDILVDNTTPGHWRKIVKMNGGHGQQEEKWVDRLRQKWEAEEEAKRNGENQNER